MHLFKLLAVVAALTVMAAVAARAEAIVPQVPGSERDFAVLLLPVAGRPTDGFGLLRFRQPQDALKIVFLDVWVLNLAPNHAYDLQRATDTAVDGNCTGTNWLTLGQGLAPKAITTGRTGFGKAHLFRDLAALPAGARFDIRFRVVDSATSALVLASGCYRFTVSP
jgi:hypothetical protein